MPPRACRPSGRCGCWPRTPAQADLRLAGRRLARLDRYSSRRRPAVLTTGTFEVAPVDDPCELPPTGGYRGLENQLYRVEIHDPGQPGGTATFKWSRENASVGSRVASMVSAGELELATLGRDDVLSLQDRRLGRDHRRRARVLAGARRDAQGHGDRGDAPHPVHAGAARRRCCRQLSRTAPSPTRATCGCAAGTRSGASSAPMPAARRSRCRTSMRRLDRRHRRAGRGHDAAAGERRHGLASPRPAPRASAPATTGCSPRAPPTRRSSCSTARRRAASTTTTRASASGTSARARSPTAATPGRRPARATTAAAPPASPPRVARQRPVHDPGRGEPGERRPAAPSASDRDSTRCASRCGSTASAPSASAGRARPR